MSDNDNNTTPEMQDARVRVACTAKAECWQCGGTGWLKQTLEAGAWSSTRRLACECLAPEPTR